MSKGHGGRTYLLAEPFVFPIANSNVATPTGTATQTLTIDLLCPFDDAMLHHALFTKIGAGAGTGGFDITVWDPVVDVAMSGVAHFFVDTSVPLGMTALAPGPGGGGPGVRSSPLSSGKPMRLRMVEFGNILTTGVFIVQLYFT